MREIKLLAEVVLSDEQLKAIGCLVLEASHLESYVDEIISATCEDENIFRLLMERKMIDAKVDIMKSLIAPTIAEPAERRAFEKICSDIKTDLTKRNTVVHGDWGAARKMSISELIEQQKQDKAIAARKNSPVTVKASDVMDLALRFGGHQMKLVMFWFERIGNQHIASLKKSARQSSRLSKIADHRRSRKIAKP